MMNIRCKYYEQASKSRSLALILLVFFCNIVSAYSPLNPRLVVNNRDLGQVEFFSPEDQEDLVMTKKSFDPVLKVLSKENFEYLNEVVVAENVSLKELKNRGCQIQYDPVRLIMNISLPDSIAKEFLTKSKSPQYKVKNIQPPKAEIDNARSLFANRQEITPLGRTLSRILEYADTLVVFNELQPESSSIVKVPTNSVVNSVALLQSDSIVTQEPKKVVSIDPMTTVAQADTQDDPEHLDLSAKRKTKEAARPSSNQSSRPDFSEALLQEVRGMRSLLSQMAQRDNPLPVGTSVLPVLSQIDSVKLKSEEDSKSKSRADSLLLAEQERKIIDEQFGSISKEELYAKIFGISRPARAHKVFVDISIDSRVIGQGQITYSNDFKSYQVESKVLANALHQLLVPIKYNLLNTQNFIISEQAFKNAGLVVKLDEELFKLNISIPMDFRKEQRFDLSWLNKTDSIEYISPAILSAFLNIRSSQDWLYQEVFFDDDSLKRLYLDYFDGERIKRQSVLSELEGALNFQGWILEGSGRYSEPDTIHSGISKLTHGFWRDEFRLVHDFGQDKIRLSAGDIRSGGRVHGAVTIPLLGFRLDLDQNSARSSIKNPNSNNSDLPQNWMQFQLQHPGNADVRVNGRSVARLRLEAGPNAIGGFQGVVGVNQVDVVVNYDNGDVESIPFQFVEERRGILDKGSRNFSIVAGVARQSKDQGISYSLKNDSATIGFNVEQGLSHGWLTGFAVDLSKERGIGRAILETPFNHRGTYSINTIMSFDWFSGQWGYQLGFGASKPFLAGSEFQAGIQYYSRFFNSMILGTSTFNIQPVRVNTSLGFSVPIWKGIMSLALDTRFNRESILPPSSVNVYSPVDYSFVTSYGLSLFNGLSLNASSHVSVKNKDYNPSFTIFATYFFSKGRNNFQLSNQLVNSKHYIPPSLSTKKVTDINNSALTSDSLLLMPGYTEREWRNNSYAQWSYSHGLGLNDGYATAIGGNFQTDVMGVNTNFNYTHNNFQAMASYNMSDYSQFMQLSRNHYLSTRLETSLLFADGLWSLGRTVQNGFVLVDGQYELDDTPIRIAPDDMMGSEVSRSTQFMAGSFPHLGEYQKSMLRLVPENPPLGSWSGKEIYSVQSEYKRGFALRVGNLPTVLVQATFVDESGEPIKRNTFTVHDKENPSVILMESFTTSKGLMQAGNLTPGRTYVVRFPKDSFIDDLEIKLAKSARGVVQLGKIVVQHQRMSQRATAESAN